MFRCAENIGHLTSFIDYPATTAAATSNSRTRPLFLAGTIALSKSAVLLDRSSALPRKQSRYQRCEAAHATSIYAGALERKFQSFMLQHKSEKNVYCEIKYEYKIERNKNFALQLALNRASLSEEDCPVTLRRPDSLIQHVSGS